MKGSRPIAESRVQLVGAPPARRRLATRGGQAREAAAEAGEERLGGPLAWSSGEPADARQLQRFAEMREEIERRVDGRERRRLHRALEEWNLQLGLRLDGQPANDDEPSA